MTTSIDDATAMLTGRCYCGRTTVGTTQVPLTIAYCHCIDCRRVTGAPVAAFAAFDERDVIFTPNEGSIVGVNPGVKRTFCPACGTPLTGRYDYLPGQVYIPVSILDQADQLAPRIHTQESQRLQWLHIDDDLERVSASGRSQLNEASK